MRPLIQLPNDTVSIGYKKVSAFEWAQVFSSASCGFSGTECEFVAAGHAYAYTQVSPFARLEVSL